MDRQAQIYAAEAKLNAAAAERGLPGFFSIEMGSDGNWRASYWWNRTRPVTNKQKSIDDAVERALLWLTDRG